MSTLTLLGLFGLPGGGEWIILLILGLLIFGRRLPEVGRSIGKSVVEFKKGIKGIEEEIEDESSRPGAKKQIEADTAESLPEGSTSESSEARAKEEVKH